MNEDVSQVPAAEPGTVYMIEIKGYLDSHWSEWLGGLDIRYDERGHTLLEGVVSDQAALHGILEQIRDLGLTLVSLTSQRGI